jgi:hypothetical protein
VETILSALGLPYHVAGGSDEAGPIPGAVRLVAAEVGAAPGHSPAGGPVVALPSTGFDTARTFASLSREEEYAPGERDEHDRFLWSHSRDRDETDTAGPWVSEQGNRLLSAIKDVCGRAGLPLIRKEPWPMGKVMAASLTHDVDAVQRGKLPRGVAVRDVTGALRSATQGRFRSAARQVAAIARTAASRTDPYWSFDRISSMEREHGFRSTYFFMSTRIDSRDATYDLSAPSMARLMDGLAGAGCEIALHGSYAAPADAALLRGQRSRLERALGAPVSGYRNHLLRFRVPGSWLAQEAAGLSYDSTLGFADHEGFRGGHAFPFHPYDLASDRGMGILELPLAVMDVTISKYRKLRGEPAWKAVLAVLEQTLAVGGLATLLWHNDTFFDLDHPGSGRLYERSLRWLSERDVHVATCAEIDRWWRARAAVRLTALTEHGTGWSVEVPEAIEGLALRIQLPDARLRPCPRESVPATIEERDGEYLLRFGRLPAGARLHIDCR